MTPFGPVAEGRSQDHAPGPPHNDYRWEIRRETFAATHTKFETDPKIDDKVFEIPK